MTQDAVTHQPGGEELAPDVLWPPFCWWKGWCTLVSHYLPSLETSRLELAGSGCNISKEIT